MNRAKFDVKLYDLEDGKPYTKGKCRIFYVGNNRNRSHISQECADYMGQNIGYTPVIGEYSETIENFKGHGGKVVIEDNSITYVDTTKPYGCAMNEPVWYEEVTEDNGDINNYMCCNVALWDKRYPELKKVLEQGSHQSMEIEILDSEFKDGIFYIKKANFLGLCILGKDDENPENDTEPCFETSTIEVENVMDDKLTYSLKKDDFVNEFNLMLKEMKLSSQNQSSFDVDNIDSSNENIKFSENNKEGGNENLNEKLELLAKYNLTIEQLDFNIEDFTLEEIESKIEKFNTEAEEEVVVESEAEVDATVEETTEEVEEFEVEKETEVVEFSATYNQKREALSTILATITGENEWMYISDMSDEYVFVQKETYDNGYTQEFGRYAYTFDETELTATITSEFEKMILQWLTEEENQKLADRRSAVDAEFTRLQEFEKTVLDAERTNSEQEIFANYDEKLSGEQAYTDIKENASNYSLVELEEKIALIFVKTTQNFSINKNKKETVKFTVEKDEEKETESRYGDLHNKYLK